LQEHRQVRKSVHWSNLLSILARTSIVAVLGLLLLGATLCVNVRGAQALGVCSGSDHTYVVVRGDTLSRIANRYGVDNSELASYNHIANSNLIYLNQRICIPGTGFGGGSSASSVPTSASATNISTQTSLTSTSTTAVLKAGNQFPYPACTWWANERYRQLHGVYVPWRTNANAWQWTTRAYNFGGMFLGAHQLAPLSICSPGSREHTAKDMLAWSSKY
jgi:LysM repeat protein